MRIDGRRFSAIRVDQITKLFGWLEEGNALGRNIDLGACLRVAAGASVTLTRPKTAEAANFDFVTRLQSTDDGFEEGIDDHFAVASG